MRPTDDLQPTGTVLYRGGSIYSPADPFATAMVVADGVVGWLGSEEAAATAGADYWGVGPWRSTDTKADAGAALGIEGFRRIVQLARGKPCIAVGGVYPDDVGAVHAAGGAGVAVVSGILGEVDVEAAARRYATLSP